MTRVLWWAMYLLSAGIGYALGLGSMLLGYRYTKPLRELVVPQARQHADEAARREGPYLAPFTVLIPFAAIAVLALVMRVIA